SSLDIAVGLVSLWLSRKMRPASGLPVPSRGRQGAVLAPLGFAVAFSGWSTMVYEVTWNRVAGLLFGPTSATVSLTLAVVLLGLAAGALVASAVRRNQAVWLCWSQLTAALLLLGASYSVAISPAWFAEQTRSRSDSVFRMWTFESAVLLV